MDIKRELEVMKEVKEANERHLQEWKDSMMLAVYVDVYDTGRAKTIRIARDLEEYYRLIGCDTVTMPMRYIGGKQFIIIADDEGTFRKDCRVSAMNGDEPMLVGNLLVVAFDGVEDIRGLTREEADHVLRHTKGRGRMDEKGRLDIWEILTDVTYSEED